MKLIGLSGYARSGKDEAAKILVEEYGFVRVAFADKLRDVLYALDPILDVRRADAGLQVNTPQGTKKLMFDENTPSTIPISVNVGLQSVIDKYGWNGYKETAYGPEIRRLLQRLGTEAGRNTLWDSIWVDAALTGLDDSAKVVVTDMRFPNEYDAIRERGGQAWRIKRTGVAAFNAHPSETSLDSHAFDCVIDNDSDLYSFHKKIRNAYTYSKLG